MADAPEQPPGKTVHLRRAKPRIATSDGKPTEAASQTQLDNALRLLQAEADIRRARTVAELSYHLANETRPILGFRQLFFLRRRGARLRLDTVSSVASFEKNAPLTRWIEGMVRALSAEEGLDKPVTFALPAYADPNAEETKGYAFRHFLWVPLFSRRGALFGGMLMSRERPWPGPTLVLADRLAGAYAYAFASFQGRRLEKPRSGLRTALKLAAVAGIVAAAFIPVPLTVLAPVEITGRDAPIVTAPLDGVVAEILVRPDAQVAAGETVARLDDTELRNALEIATQDVAVAEVELEQRRQSAFVDYSTAGEVAVAEAQLALARAEQRLATDRLARVDMTAPRAGRVVIDDPQDWIGRPVALGERVMAIADPAHVEARIELSTGDAIDLAPGAKVRVFLDTDPLAPLDATLSDLPYAAEPLPDGTLAFTLKAQLAQEEALPRIGARGTAQIFGQTHPLWFVVFRRPIAAARQALGI